MSTACALGLDLGTSGLKAVLVDVEGKVVAQAARPYDVRSPRPGWAESEPADWESAARTAVLELLEQAADTRVVGIGIDGQMHGAVLTDGVGEPVRPAVLWPDNRAADQLPRWRALDEKTLLALANPLTPGMAGPVLGWLAEHESATVTRARHFLSPKDWLRSRLVSGSFVTDPSDASATLMWSVALDDWDEDLCREVGIDPSLLPETAASASVAGGLVAERWTLPPGVPVSVGCADAAATIMGTPAVPGRYTLTVGTGAQVVLPEVAPSSLGPIRYHTYRQADEGYYAMAALMNAGLCLARVVRLLGATWADLYNTYDPLRPVPGFLPFISGERLPLALKGSQGGWFGIGLETERSDLLAAALEGVAFAVRRVLADLPDAKDAVVDVTGGGSRHPVFVQLLADVLGRPLRLIERPDATALGAARLGWAVSGSAMNAASEASGTVIEPSTSTPVLDALSGRYETFLARCDQVGGGS